MGGEPIVVQVNGLLAKTLLISLLSISFGILVKKAWDIFFADKKKLSEAVTRTTMEAYVREIVQQTMKEAFQQFELDCIRKRSNCSALASVIAKVEKTADDFKEDVRRIHEKIDDHFTQLNQTIVEALKKR